MMMIFPSASHSHLMCKKRLTSSKSNPIFVTTTTTTRPTTLLCLKHPPHAPRRISTKTPSLAHVLPWKNEGTEKGFVGGSEEMMILCGVGYWVQGFRCFPWLALNFHMTHALGLTPSTLQLVQSFGNLPMVLKPAFGILSDAFSIAGARRIPYICIGVILQILSWVLLALNPFPGRSLLTLVALVLLGNLGASVTEVAKDGLVAAFGQKRQIVGLQTYALMVLAFGAGLGNFLGGYFVKMATPRRMFLVFALVLSLQLSSALVLSEDSLGLSKDSVSKSFGEQISELGVAIGDAAIARPLVWIMASIALVPSLSGSIFCYQTQCLNLDPLIIGKSRVMGQLLLLLMTATYHRYRQKIPMRKLVTGVQILYAGCVLLDLALVKQINLKIGIPNENFTLCFSGLSDMITQFKVLPFAVLLASLCPVGCEGSLMSFLPSALCLATIASGLLGVGLVNYLGITSSNYSKLPLGISVQFMASLMPLLLYRYLPDSRLVSCSAKIKRRVLSKRSRRKRRVGKVGVDPVFFYRQQREF